LSPSRAMLAAEPGPKTEPEIEGEDGRRLASAAIALTPSWSVLTPEQVLVRGVAASRR
jgi:hypothetical protein